VRVLGTHDHGGCGYYRVVQPLTELGKHDGWDVTVFQATGGVSGQQMAGHDLIAAQRFDNHGGMGVWRRQRAQSKLVYELDDDVFSVEQVNWQAYSTYSRADVQDAVAHYAQVADLVTVSTEPLAEVMRRFNPNVAVLPNHVPGWVLDLPAPQGERPAVGWAGGSSHGLDIQIIARPVREFLDRHPEWDAVLIGSDYRPTVRHSRCGFIPWTHITDDAGGYYRSLDFDIGLAPIHPTVFSRSKSHIKCLEYAARGIPVIASDCDAYRDFVLHGVTGFLVKYDNYEWLKYLEELLDPGLRAEMGAKAREVARDWTIERGWKLWADAYEGLFA
jgi:glycosyltransferase involved in cell wall biosynthesis